MVRALSSAWRRRHTPLLRLAALALAAISVSAPAAELSLRRQDGFRIPVEINGVTLHLRVDPAASGIVILNPEAASLAGVSPDELYAPVEFAKPRRRAFARVGPVKLTGKAGIHRLVVGGRPLQLQVGWFDSNVVEGADGLISPEHLPYDRVSFDLAPAGEAEEEYRIPLAYQLNAGLYHTYAVAGRVVPVQFSLLKPSNIATAAGGAVLAQAHGGIWRGARSKRDIAFGIARPVRPMALGQPIRVKGLEVREFWVRTGDHRGDHSLPSDTSADPDEIVVTASIGSRQAERLQLVLGLDQFSACSRVTYVSKERRLTLRCQTPPGAQ